VPNRASSLRRRPLRGPVLFCRCRHLGRSLAGQRPAQTLREPEPLPPRLASNLSGAKQGIWGVGGSRETFAPFDEALARSAVLFIYCVERKLTDFTKAEKSASASIAGDSPAWEIV
jgi:hypothetical protein